jgi:hypothetical protein
MVAPSRAVFRRPDPARRRSRQEHLLSRSSQTSVVSIPKCFPICRYEIPNLPPTMKHVSSSFVLKNHGSDG